MESTIKERLDVFIKSKGLSRMKFEQQCGLSNGYVANIRDGIGSIKLNDITKRFPELSQEWLLTGEGAMLRPLPQGTQGANSPILHGSRIDNSYNSNVCDRVLDKLSEVHTMLVDIIQSDKNEKQQLLSIIENLTRK